MKGTARWGPWGAGAALALPVLLSTVAFRSKPETPVVSDRRQEMAGPRIDRSEFDSLAAVAARKAPFRVDGHPAAVAYDPTRAEAPIVGYAPPKPALQLTGLTGGRTPTAIIGGIPGHDGPAVLSKGDTMNGFMVRTIKEDRVTVTGMDTTWVLVLRGAP